MLSPRTETILKLIVEQYIATAVPVPSQVLYDEYRLGVSPATIRHEMASLEEQGYLIRPHPSAGSIPSDKGYRHYVESLSGVGLPLDEQRLIGHLFHQVEGEQEGWLRLAATLVARLAKNVSIVTMPKPPDCRFRHLELFALQDSLVLVVLVLHGARVKQQLITFETVISQPELTAAAKKLNKAYAGLTGSQILATGVELSPTECQLADCAVKVIQAEDEQEYDEPYLDGLHFTLSQPEFVDANRMLELMELVEQRSLLKAILPQKLGIHEVQIVIGKENRIEAIHNCSVVIGRYGLPKAAGIIGVIGPTRMSYAYIIPTVSYLSSVLSLLAGKLYDEQYEGVKTSDRAKFRRKENE
jgi:heat-inducible transcriptional repressor